jgi:hypothetical protein
VPTAIAISAPAVFQEGSAPVRNSQASAAAVATATPIAVYARTNPPDVPSSSCHHPFGHLPGGASAVTVCADAR